jgi:hypothetical protein
MTGSAAAALKPFRKLRRLTDMEFIALLVPEYNTPLVNLLFAANFPGVLPYCRIGVSGVQIAKAWFLVTITVYPLTPEKLSKFRIEIA